MSGWKSVGPSVASSISQSSNEKYVTTYDRIEDVDQKRVTVPINRDLRSPNTQTHTGQAFDEDDYRNIRFVNKGKLVC